VATATEERTYIRQDGKEKVTGVGRYTADLTLAGQLHAKFRYADHSRARILRIDTAAARELPGVFAVLTHEAVPDVLYGQLVKDRRLFAKDEVRYEADVIAGVAALTPEIAARAVELIEVEYEVLPYVIDVEDAMKPNAPTRYSIITRTTPWRARYSPSSVPWVPQPPLFPPPWIHTITGRR